MTTTNEPKYAIKDGKLVNRHSGEPIPEDEPIFILRGKDLYARKAIFAYLEAIPDTTHVDAVEARYNQFYKFAADNLERMHEPDTIITDDWPKQP